MDSKSQFNSPDLQKVFDQIEPILSQHKTQLDQISSDIKEVERFLRSCGIHFPMRYCCRERTKVIDEDPFHHQTKQICYRDYLCWDKSKDGQYRLLYEVEEQLLVCQNGSDSLSKPNHLIKSRPLIEAKVKVRLELYPKLPQFLEEVAKSLQSAQTRQTREEIAKSIESLSQERKSKDL